MATRAFAALIIVALSVPLTAQLATGEIVRHHLIAPGGQAASGALQIYALIGQPAVGSAAGTSLVHKAGYVHLLLDYYTGTLVAVAITAFDAAIIERQVELTWAVGEADGLMGFNVYRTETEDTSFRRLHDQLLPADDGFSYRDDSVRPGQRYTYRLGAVDNDGEFLSFDVNVVIPTWETELRQNFPNPFNPTTTIEYYLDAPERVSLGVYDVAGRLVRTLVDDHQPFGRHDVTWDGINTTGASVSSGIYFYRLRAGKNVFTKKMTLLK